MLKNIRLENMLKSKSSTGLEVTLMPDGSHQFYLVVLKKQQATLVTEKQIGPLYSFNDVQAHIDPKAPLILVINGKGIVHRKIHRNETDTSATLLGKLLPNATVEEFVLQEVALPSDEAFVSVIRTNVLNELMEELINHKLANIAACFLGPFVLTNLLPLLEKNVIDNGYLYANNFRLQIQEEQIVSLETFTSVPIEQYRIGNDLLSHHLLIPFAGALSYFTNAQNTIANANLVDQLKEEFKQKQTFELRGWTLLISTFLILIINYLVFNNYWTKNKEMNAQLELTQVALQRYDKLKSDYDQKRKFLEQNGMLENSRTSYYADRLAKDLPASVQFTGLNIHPLKKKNPGEEDKGFLFENKSVLVSGNCKRNTELNEWMKKMKKENWVEDLTLLNYRQDNKDENGIFLIEIKLK